MNLPERKTFVRMCPDGIKLLGLFLIVGLGLSGCVNGKNDIQETSSDPFASYQYLASDLGEVSTAYYTSRGSWPSSLDNLETLQPGQVPDRDLASLSNDLARIPWQELKGRTTFADMPDGTLNIYVTHLEGGEEVIAVNKPVISSTQYTRIVMDLADASTAYYATRGHWPSSLDSLEALPPRKVVAGYQNCFTNSMMRIPAQELKGKVTFKKMPDGPLYISIPPSEGGGASTIVLKPDTTHVINGRS
jgi:hypothetical protein